MRLQNKVAVITGGASGIGRATAKCMAEAGATIAVADINRVGAEAVVAEIVSCGQKAAAFPCDVADPNQVHTMITEVHRTFGRIDILDNNAADLSLLPYDQDLLNTDVATWDKTYAADQRSVMVACKAVLPLMIAQGSGCIINISSVDGFKGDTTRFAYQMAKAALNILTQSIAITYGKQGIRCNAIAPGLAVSPDFFGKLPPKAQAIWHQSVQTPFIGQPQHIAAVALFLAGNDAAYLNGQIITVDGGLMSQVPHLGQFRADPSLPH